MSKTPETPAPAPAAPAAAPAVQPLPQGLAAIKAEDPDALRIWQVKGPRQGGGQLLGVLMQSTGEVVIIHQFDSGRYAVYGRRAAKVKPEVVEQTGEKEAA